MKVADVKVHVLSVPLKGKFSFSQGWVNSRSSVIIEVVTDNGVIGWGESLCHGQQPPEVSAAFIQFVFRPMLLGRDPFDACHCIMNVSNAKEVTIDGHYPLST